MAKALFFLTMVLLATVAMTDAALPERELAGKRKKELITVWLKVDNKATEDVGILVAELGKSAEVVAKKATWTSIGPIVVDLTVHHILHLHVTVKNYKNVPVTEACEIDVLKWLKGGLKGEKFLVLQVIEDVKAKLLYIKIGLENLLILKL